MLHIYLAVFFTLVPAVAGLLDCPNFNNQTWFAVAGSNCYNLRAYTANLTNRDYCYDSINFVMESHVTLDNPGAIRRADSVADPIRGSKNCGLNITDIDYCDSHCMDKDVEDALIDASMMISQNSDSIWQAARDNMKELGKADWPILMIEPFPWNSAVDYQYYDDMNYCVVDVLFILPAGDYYPAWPFRSFFVTQKTLPTSG